MAKHWWGISSYQGAGGASKRAGGEIPPTILYGKNALLHAGFHKS